MIASPMPPIDPQRFLPLHPRDYLILFALTEGSRHGYGIVKDIESFTGGTVSLDPSNLYRSIKRLVETGLVAESDQEPEDPARRRMYEITTLGRNVVTAEAERLAQLTDAARGRRLIPRA